jgi:hypothetical protein
MEYTTSKGIMKNLPLLGEDCEDGKIATYHGYPITKLHHMHGTMHVIERDIEVVFSPNL